MNYDEVRDLLSEPQKIVIITHQNPDGDAVGSSLGLWHFLKGHGQEDVTVITPNDYPDFLHWMPGNDSVKVFYHNKKTVPQQIEESTVIFCLDFNSLNRISGLAGSVKHSKATRFLIDHHLEPDIFAKHMMSKPEASSTAELIFDFIEGVAGREAISNDIAECLYAGIVSDTGRFKFATNSRVYEIMSFFMSIKLDTEKVNDRIFNSFSENRLRLFGFALTERMKFIPECNACIMWLDEADKRKFKFQPGDTEGLVNYPLFMSNCIFSVLITEKDGLTKMSLRSKGGFSAQKIASEYFNGGGHFNASGGRSDKSVLDTVTYLEYIIKDHKQELVEAANAYTA